MRKAVVLTDALSVTPGAEDNRRVLAHGFERSLAALGWGLLTTLSFYGAYAWIVLRAVGGPDVVNRRMYAEWGMTDTTITAVHGRRVWDSRGRPTVEAEVTLACGATGRAIAPAGFLFPAGVAAAGFFASPGVLPAGFFWSALILPRRPLKRSA